MTNTEFQNKVKTSGTFVVGIGASAGGLESLESLFRNIPANSGMAFVVIQHLSPDFKSMMSELLARDTSMPIRVAEEGDCVQANTIYLMPPKKQMTIADGILHLSDKDLKPGVALPIDHFLRSLALDRGKEAIAIILSGSGTDGSRGIAEISRHGGLVISESLDTAKFDGMPSSAQATGLVDLVLAPSEMGAALMNYQSNPEGLARLKFPQPTPERNLKGIDAIVQLFRTVYDIDFASYKENTVLRRTSRRLAMNNLETFDEYADYLQSNPDELHALYRDLLIGVTQFFRDPEAFHLLIHEILPELIRRRAVDTGGIRGWIAGCATGEEAYSLAIALQEAMRATNTFLPTKLFATDVHKRSIEHAGRGVYSTESLKEVPSEYVERYFVPRDDGYQVSSDIRRLIVFSPHNVLRDAPFTDIDFISCRNLLIYFQTFAQRRAVSLFHYGLKVGGLLFLGSSESPGELSGEFQVVNEKYRIYRKTRDIRLAHNLRSPLTSADALSLRTSSPAARSSGGSGNSAALAKIVDILLPPSILINRDRTVLDTYAGAEKLLRLPAHRPSLDILELVDPSLRTSLAGAIGQAARKNQLVRLGKVALTVDREGEPRHFGLTVQPLFVEGDDQYYLISLAPQDSTDTTELLLPVAPATEVDASREHIRQLESELQFSRENLQATIEELETSNEELQATNEELIASNEELQSTNEELHSLNEELYSVNAEHQRKIEELAEVNRDMAHLLENTDVATIFLDRELRIRRFTSRVSQLYDLIDSDVGRPLLAFSPKVPVLDLETHLQEVLTTGVSFERELAADDGTCYLMRILPYRTNHKVDGLVLMWVDVSSLEALRGRLRWMSAIVESTNDAVIGQDLNGSITSWNHGAELLYGYTADEAIGKSIDMLVPETHRAEVQQYRTQIVQSQTTSTFDTVRLRKDGTAIDVSLTISPVYDGRGNVVGISKIARDIRQRVEMEREIRRQIKQRERFLAVLSHELRNPLNAVSSASFILLDPRATESLKVRAAETIQRQVETMNHLLGDLLDVARVAENRINLNLEELDLREIVQALPELLQVELDRYQCTLEFVLPESPMWVRGDRTRLMQVFVNLVHNAAKHSESTEPIRIAMAGEQQAVHVSVMDRGRGIAPEMLDKVFEPFMQLEDARRRSDGGLGVGLALVKTLVELHRGRVRAESEGEGRGSVFHVCLPRLAREGLARADISSEEATFNVRSREPSLSPRPCQQTLRICLVEDVAESQSMMKTLMELDGHQVVTASSGLEAIHVLSRETFDLAFVDIGLPDITGYEVAHQVRNSETGNSVRLVALTGYGQPDDLENARQSGFDQHVVKPITSEKLRMIYDSMERAIEPTNTAF